MQNSPNSKQSAQQPAKPRIRLPFGPKKADPGSWSYDHRVGICITLIAYLVFGIIFVAGKIKLGGKSGISTILVEFPEEEKVRKMPTPEELQKMQQLQDFSNIANRLSNDNAELNSDLRDDRGTNSSELYEDASALSDQMRANREAYEAGLAREKDKINAARNSGGSTAAEGQNRKYAGRVMVSFSLENPTRYGSLITPGYQCEGGGEVVVNITVDNNGRVVSAAVDRSLSYGDDCIFNTAVREAQKARFNVDNSAPAKHKGTITYIFIPQ